MGWPPVQHVQLQGNCANKDTFNNGEGKVLDDSLLVGLFDGYDLPKDLLAGIMQRDNFVGTGDFLGTEGGQWVNDGHWRDRLGCAQHSGHMRRMIICTSPCAAKGRADVV